MLKFRVGRKLLIYKCYFILGIFSLTFLKITPLLKRQVGVSMGIGISLEGIVLEWSVYLQTTSDLTIVRWNSLLEPWKGWELFNNRKTYEILETVISIFCEKKKKCVHFSKQAASKDINKNLSCVHFMLY